MSKSLNTFQPDPKPSIYDFKSYREFLRSFYEWRKAKPRGFSYRQFSKLLGYSAPNYIKLVIDGERAITPTNSEACALNLGLVDRQVKYFVKLVELDQANSDEEKMSHLQELRAMLPLAKKRELPLDDLEYLSHWLFPVIRELCYLPDFVPESHWIERRLRTPVARGEVESCLSALIKSNYIFKDQDGRYKARDELVVSTDELHSMAIRNYHRKILDQGKDALEHVPMSEREFAAITLMLPESKLAELKERLKAFRNEIHDWAALCSLTEQGDTVIQCNFQVYPQNRSLEKKKL